VGVGEISVDGEVGIIISVGAILAVEAHATKKIAKSKTGMVFLFFIDYLLCILPNEAVEKLIHLNRSSHVPKQLVTT